MASQTSEWDEKDEDSMPGWVEENPEESDEEQGEEEGADEDEGDKQSQG